MVAQLLLLIVVVAVVPYMNTLEQFTIPSLVPYKTYPSLAPYQLANSNSTQQPSKPPFPIEPRHTADIKLRPLRNIGIIAMDRKQNFSIDPRDTVQSGFHMHPKHTAAIKTQPFKITHSADYTLECLREKQVAIVSPGESVQFYSINYPSNYRRKTKCNWQIQGNAVTTLIRISCDTFNLQNANGRGYCGDFLDIDGFRYCGRNYPVYSSLSNIVNIFFKSNRRRQYTGFSCTATAYDASTTTTPITETCSCGRVNRATRIVGGIETEVNEYPWMVALARSKYSSSAFCGGSIINERWILTAAHCADVMSLSNVVIAGEHTWSTDTETSATQKISIQQILMNPSYSSSTLDSDVALIQLASPLTFDASNNVAPICPPDATDLYENVDAIVTGWGTLHYGGSQPDSLQEVVVPTMNNSVCQSSYGSAITDNMICAGFDDGGKDSCQGDSGGPLITADGSIYRQIGVVSWGYRCAYAGYPGVYARVTSQLSWIASSISGTSWCEAGTAVTTKAPTPDCRCGRVNRSTRIINGQETEVLEYPWQAGLVNYGYSRTWCGGSLINSRWVLTAAHCTIRKSPSQLQVLLGEHTIYEIDATEQRFDVSSIINHPSYTSAPWINGHDISLLELSSEVDFSSTQIRPICLPSTSDLFAGANATVTGWGRTSSSGSQSLVLMEVDIPVVTNTVCEYTYGSSSIDDTMICAGEGAGNGACMGDSGGPLITSLGDYHIIIGVVSFGSRYCDSLGVYTRVTALQSWIEGYAMAGDVQICSP